MPFPVVFGSVGLFASCRWDGRRGQPEAQAAAELGHVGDSRQLQTRSALSPVRQDKLQIKIAKTWPDQGGQGGVGMSGQSCVW